MTINQVYINDHAISSTYSASLIEDSYTNLLLPPSLKDYAVNDLRSQPGKQVFVVNPQPKDRDVQLTFLIQETSIESYLAQYEKLVDELHKGIINLKVAALKLVFKLLATSYISLDAYSGGNTGKLVVKFNEPNPLDRIRL